MSLLVCRALFAADFEPLKVKTGQWQVTLTGQTTGTPPIPDEVLRRLSQEQRDKLQQSIQSGGASGTKRVVKTCVTKDKLDKPFSLGDESKACTRTLVTSSGAKQEIRVECAQGATKSSGSVMVNAVDSENVKGTMQMSATNGSNTMKMNYDFVAKWLAPACPADK
jgi:hypothetical protein